MDPEIKRGVDGLYAVCFKNSKAYSEQKIWEMFGRYGKVVNVRFSGHDKYGMVFIRYRNYDETKNCLEDLTKTKKLSVRMALCTKRPFHGPMQQNGDTFGPLASNGVSEESNNANFQHNGTNYGGLKNNFHMNFKQRNGPKRNFFQPKSENGPKSENSLRNRELPRQSAKKNGTENEVPQVEEPLKGEMLNGLSEHETDDTAEMKSSGATRRKANIWHPGSENNLINSHSRDRNLQSSETSSDIPGDGPPPLADFKHFCGLVGERPEVYAKDVIIANLPPAVDINDVISLARRLPLYPVLISPIETTGIRYNMPLCHLWMENDYFAEVAVSELRGTYMEGKKLLVARAEDLLRGII